MSGLSEGCFESGLSIVILSDGISEPDSQGCDIALVRRGVSLESITQIQTTETRANKIPVPVCLALVLGTGVWVAGTGGMGGTVETKKNGWKSTIRQQKNRHRCT